MNCPKAVMFDLDETLAPSFQSPARSMVDRLMQLLEAVPVAIISGAGFDRIDRDFLSTLDHSPHVSRLYIFANSGSQAFSWQDSWNEEYNFSLTEEERSRIKAVISAAAIELPEIREARVYGDQIADREAQIAFTVVGLDAPAEYKASWDPQASKRRVIREYLLKELPEYDIRTGGASTIDITRRGVNKAYGVGWLAQRLHCNPSDMLYVGDALYEGGNDSVVIPTGIQTHSVAGPSETEHVIDDVLAACSVQV